MDHTAEARGPQQPQPLPVGQQGQPLGVRRHTGKTTHSPCRAAAIHQERLGLETCSGEYLAAVHAGGPHQQTCGSR